MNRTSRIGSRWAVILGVMIATLPIGNAVGANEGGVQICNCTAGCNNSPYACAATGACPCTCDCTENGAQCSCGSGLGF